VGIAGGIINPAKAIVDSQNMQSEYYFLTCSQASNYLRGEAYRRYRANIARCITKFLGRGGGLPVIIESVLWSGSAGLLGVEIERKQLIVLCISTFYFRVISGCTTIGWRVSNVHFRCTSSK
jgi:hypothetical protein